MGSTRRTAVWAGIFFVVAAAASIPALALYQPLLSHPGYVLGAGADAQIRLGALLEFVTAAACIGTGVTLYPVVRRQNPGIALGYAAGRVFEAVMIAVGVLAVLAAVSLRADGAATGADDRGLVAAAQSLIAVHDWTFLLGPGLAIGVNTTLLAWLMYRSALVARWIPVIGLLGGPLVFLSSSAVLFGAYEQVSVVAMLAAVPVFVWEMSLAGYLIVKGFRSSSTLAPAAAGEPGHPVLAHA